MAQYSKTKQTDETPVKLKHCSKCDKDLLLINFTSTRAKYCNPCKRIDKLEKQAKRTRRQLERTKSKKQKKKTVIRISDLKKQVQRVFNKWIRERDKDEPCLACKRQSDKMDASHFIAQGSSGYLRYHPNNVNNTCYSCNRFKGGNLLEYRENLIHKISEDKVNWLWNNRHKTYKYKREQLEEIITCCKRNTMSVECWYEIMHKM